MSNNDTDKEGLPYAVDLAVIREVFDRHCGLRRYYARSRGISPSTITRWMNGTVRIPSGWLLLIIFDLGLSPDKVITFPGIQGNKVISQFSADKERRKRKRRVRNGSNNTSSQQT